MHLDWDVKSCFLSVETVSQQAELEKAAAEEKAAKAAHEEEERKRKAAKHQVRGNSTS